MLYFRRLIAILALGLIPTLAYGTPSTDEARTQIDTAFNQVKEVVAKEKETLSPQDLNTKLRSILAPKFDFDDMARSSLGANWNKGTPEEQTEFVTLFSELLGRTYLAKIRKNVETSEITYLPPMTKGDRVVIRSVIKTDGGDVAADYRMFAKDGQWRIYDVIVENVGLVANYRNEFASILRKENFSGLLVRLREQTETNRINDAALTK